MKQYRLVLMVIAVSLIPASLNAQRGIKFRGSGSWCFGDRYDQAFINSNQETVVGQVMSIDTVTPYRDMASGIRMMLKTEREDITVHLGPAWFILYQDM
ncbi:MAG: hypothetical protein JW913_08790, partial [Chitinispirillaceae bacterium]|nr:hypothetical protein [Chitinispirillaceae bacterium]